MAIIFKTEERRIIPRLRSFELAATTGELNLHNGKKSYLRFNSREFLQEQISAWRKYGSLSHAEDLLSSAFALGIQDDYKDVADFILKQPSTSGAMSSLALRVLGRKAESVEYAHLPNEIAVRTEINAFKHSLRREPKNPIGWMELGRLYSLVGQVDKANKAVETALFLDKDNRFVVRSASRYFHHFSAEKDKPLFIIRNAEFSKSDPWLISADIAYSTILGRYSKATKVGEELIKKSHYSFDTLTELTSALGTTEYINGRIKDARRYLNQSLLVPNENSLAQAAWLSDHITGIDIDNSKYDIPLAFEANSLHAYSLGDYHRAYEEALKWHEDEPFSARPIKLAAYIASVFLKNHLVSVSLTRKALQYSPDDTMLINNLVYYLMQNDEIEEGRKLFNDSLARIVEEPDKYSDNIKIVCSATAGLVAFKSNQFAAGALYYEKAIAYAKAVKNTYLVGLATANYAKEAMGTEASLEEKNVIIGKLKEACRSVAEPDVNQIYKDVMMAYDASFTIGLSSG